MKKFNKEILRKEYTNGFGESMILVLDQNDKIWFYHSDCNNDFEPYKNLWITTNFRGTDIEHFNYVLDADERKVIEGFVDQIMQLELT